MNFLKQNLSTEEAYNYYLKEADEDWKKGALYIRVSTNDQVEYSPASQIKIGLKYAIENQIFISHEHIFQDDGISGRQTDKRLDFMKMITLAKSKSHPFDVILVYSFSRFARNREDSIVYKSMLRKKCGVDVISITQPLSEGKESIILESIYEAMDEYYSLDLSENSRRGKQEKATRGEWQGNPPYGYIYDKNTKQLIIDEEKAKIVNMIYNDYVNGMSIKGIANKLAKKGLKSTRGGFFTDRVLKRILYNPAYIGKVRFCVGGFKRNYSNPNIQIFDGKHQPIIDKELFDKAQAINAQKEELSFKYKKPQPKHEHWLRGLLKCGDCGKFMVKIKVHNRTNAYFQCNGYIKGICFRSHHILESKVVGLILNQLKQDFTDKLNINISLSNYENESELDMINIKIKKLLQKEKKIKEAFYSGIDTLNEYKENKEAVEKEIKKLKKEYNSLKLMSSKQSKLEQIYAKSEKAYKILSDDTAPDELKSTIAHTLFEKIVYDKDNEELIIYYK